mmetsp:Transcript_1072/g.1163  ORF Transcript_1072/g.1163 Transcript_1072/m.1163 type:complete len:423 (+) Transcript_1072:287-1555(+)
MSGSNKSRQGFTETRHIRFTNNSMYLVVLVGLYILVVFQLSQIAIRATPKELSTGASDDNTQLRVVGAAMASDESEKLVVSPLLLSCNVLPENSAGGIGGAMGTLPFRPNCAARALQDTAEEQQPNNTKVACVNETQLLLSDLLSLFGSHKVALVGDSLTCQHFETLSKRLNWTSHYWFTHGPTPPRILRARQQYHMEFLGFEPDKVGYLAATPTPATPADTNSRNCTQLEYFKLRDLQRTKNVTQLLEFLLEESDIVIFNLGVHYRHSTSYQWDMTQLFQACGVVNQNQNQNTNNKYCFFRETLPQHTQPDKRKFDVFPTNWTYNDADTVHGCGVFQPTVNSIVFQSRDWLTTLSETHGVPVIRVMDEFVEAHRWHSNGISDCTHYCQDDMLWDIFHRKVLDIIMQVALPEIDTRTVDTKG